MSIVKFFMVRLVYVNMKKNKEQLNNQQGYIILVSVLVISAIAVAITISLIFLGLGASRSSLAYQQSAQAKNLANACVNQALLEIAESDFTGSASLDFENGSCTYLVTNLGGINRDIRGEAVVNNVTRRVKVLIDQINPVNITSWQEVVSF
jgi:hypothetical protein